MVCVVGVKLAEGLNSSSPSSLSDSNTTPVDRKLDAARDGEAGELDSDATGDVCDCGSSCEM